jgi:hypothetical protein
MKYLSLDVKQQSINLRIERAIHINWLRTVNYSLNLNRKFCNIPSFFSPASSHELSQVKIQLQQAIASGKLGDEMCQTYQVCGSYTRNLIQMIYRFSWYQWIKIFLHSTWLNLCFKSFRQKEIDQNSHAEI